MALEQALKRVQQRINNAAARSGRAADKIKLIAVSKTVELPKIIEAVHAGITILGENRVQEANKKISNFKSQISNVEVEWHLIGHLQKNKAKTAVRLFDLIHSVDSDSLAGELNRHADNAGKIQKILIQVKLTEETTKYGTPEKELLTILDHVTQMQNIKCEGLMTMPPYYENPENVRSYFRKLRELKDEINELRVAGCELRELSMGMSNDFEIAVEEGATMVRVGTAIFGEREIKL